jgi:hypothetical protein
MKIAHLILAHTQPDQLETLVNMLSHPDADFYIHIDAKNDATEFTSIQYAPNTHYIKNRVNIIRGTYSIVQATLNAFEEIIASGIHYDYINLLSGQDYPIKKASFIHQYFALHHGKQFMEFYSIYNTWQEAVSHITKYHLINYNVPGKYKLERLINMLMPRRRMPQNMEPVGCSKWFTITLPAAKYIVRYLKDYPGVTRFFKLSWAPDKFIFQTILYNSVYKSHMVNNNLRCIGGKEAKQHFKTAVVKDIPVSEKPDCLFARKISLYPDGVKSHWCHHPISFSSQHNFS